MNEIIDPQKYQERYENSSKEFNDKNIELFLEDLRIGRNVSGKKGRRSYARLNTHRLRLKAWEKWIEDKHQKRITELNHKELTNLYYELETGVIRKQDGGWYKSYCDYGKTIKAFWHWYQKHLRLEEQRIIPDITEDLATSSKTKSEFNYFDFEGFKKLIEHVNTKYRPLLWFLYDSGIRAPKELMNIKVSDLTKDPETGKYLLNIKEEISKTFGRKIKLMLCTEIIKEYIKNKGLEKTDRLFDINPTGINKMLSKAGYDALEIGTEEYIEETDKRTNNGKIQRRKIKNGLHLYDFRHNSACYWVQRYKKETIIRYRFGWKSSDKIEYYTQFLGIKDDIHEDDLFLKNDKTALESKVDKQDQEIDMMKKQLEMLLKQQLKQKTN